MSLASLGSSLRRNARVDLSKLPKLSDTPSPPPPDSAEPERRIADYRRDEGGGSIGADVWLSAIIGLIFVLLGRRFARYLMATINGKDFPTGANWIAGPKQGQPVSYAELQGYVMYNEAAMFLFGLALLFEAAMLTVIHSRMGFKRPMIMLAMLVAFAATVLNLIVSLMLFSTGTLPLFSLLAVAFGGYILVHEWNLLQEFTRRDADRATRA